MRITFFVTNLLPIGLGVWFPRSLAREVAHTNLTAEELKSACERVGGKGHLKTSGMYGCRPDAEPAPVIAPLAAQKIRYALADR